MAVGADGGHALLVGVGPVEGAVVEGGAGGVDTEAGGGVGAEGVAGVRRGRGGAAGAGVFEAGDGPLGDAGVGFAAVIGLVEGDGFDGVALSGGGVGKFGGAGDGRAVDGVDLPGVESQEPVHGLIEPLGEGGDGDGGGAGHLLGKQFVVAAEGDALGGQGDDEIEGVVKGVERGGVAVFGVGQGGTGFVDGAGGVVVDDLDAAGEGSSGVGAGDVDVEGVIHHAANGWGAGLLRAE